MKKLFKNKKGAITQLLQGLQTLVQATPKPILFIFFLLLLTIIGSIISLLLNAYGIYCNSANQPTQLNTNLFNNIALIQNIPNPENLNKEAMQTEDYSYALGFLPSSPVSDTCALRVPKNAKIIYTNDTETITTTPEWFYQGGICSVCNKVTIKDRDDVGVTLNTYRNYCRGNVYYNQNKTLLQRIMCQEWRAEGFLCEPPRHYYYDPTSNLYLCADNTCVGITLGQLWDEQLNNYNAQLLYPTLQEEQDPNAKNFVAITCNELKPRLTIFGIDFLSFEIFIFLTLVILLAWGYFKLNELAK